MSGVILSTRVRPDVLAELLEMWALRREKVLWLLDIRAAKATRRIARTCRVLAAVEEAQLVDGAWDVAWERARIDGASVLDRAEGVAPPRPPVDAEDEQPSSERVTIPDGILSQRGARVA